MLQAPLHPPHQAPLLDPHRVAQPAHLRATDLMPRLSPTTAVPAERSGTVADRAVSAPATTPRAEAAASGAGPGNVLEVAAGIVEALCRLPAVATTDWCDRAAACLEPVAPGGSVCVGVAEVDGGGRIVELVTVGSLPSAGAWEESWRRCPLGRLVGGVWAPGAPQAGEAWGPHAVAVSPAAMEGTRLAEALASRAGVGPGAGVLAGIAPMGAERRCVLAYLVPITTPEVGAPALLRMAMGVMGRLAGVALGTRAAPSTWISPREQQVLEGLIVGKSVRQIADELGRSPHTVHDHVKALHKKLNASSRGELVARALGFLSRGRRVRDEAPGA